MKKGLLITGGVLIVLASIVSPYFCGNLVENKFNEKIAEFQNTLQFDPNIHLEASEYTKGWFASSAKTLLQVNGQQFVMSHKIIHGPWRYFGLGTVETTLAMPASVKAKVAKLFTDQEPIMITTKIGFSGYDSITLFSPSVIKENLDDYSEMNLVWGGLKGYLKFVGDRFIADVTLPELTIKDNDQTFTVKNINFKGDAIYLYNNLSSAASKNWTGSSSLSVATLALVANEYESYSTSMDLVVNSKDTDTGTVDYDATLKFSNIKLPAGLAIVTDKSDVIEFGTRFSGLPKQPLAEFIAYLERIQNSGRVPTQMELVLAGQSLVTALLQGTPSITVRSSVTGDRGKAAISAEAKLATVDENNNLNHLLLGAKKRLVITVIPSFSESIIDEAIATGQLPMSRDEFIQAITDHNRLTLKEGEYSGQFEYKQGHFYSNGQQDKDLQQFLWQVMPTKLLGF